MQSKISFSVQCRILHDFGGNTSFSLGKAKLSDLHAEMNRTVEYARRNGDQAVIFEKIIKTVEKPIEAKGSFVQFVPKFKYNVYYGEDKVDQKFYKPFKHRGSGRQGNSLQKSFK